MKVEIHRKMEMILQKKYL